MIYICHVQLLRALVLSAKVLWKSHCVTFSFVVHVFSCRIGKSLLPSSHYSSFTRPTPHSPPQPFNPRDTPAQNGSGQSAPNKYPFLPPPEGRPEWNWMKPHLILLNIIGPSMFAKLQRYICVPLIGIPLFIALGYILQMLMTNFSPSGRGG